jgi:hypothetical protein
VLEPFVSLSPEPRFWVDDHHENILTGGDANGEAHSQSDR